MNTRVLNQLIALTDDPDAIELDENDGHIFIVLGGGITLTASLSSQAALDKLATITAQAAANERARALKAVS